MRHARRRVVRRVTRLAAVGGLLLGCAMVTRAVASEPASPPTTPRSATGSSVTEASAAPAAAALVERLGADRTAGAWLGSDGQPVVAVTDEQAAEEVRRAGAEAQLVERSMTTLKSATRKLSSAPRVAGTSWFVDYRTNEVVVRADRTVSSVDWRKLSERAKDIGGFVRMERVEGTYTTRLNGGLPMLSTSGRCSAGFNVTDGQTEFILTAGHCGPDGAEWFTDNRGRSRIGTTVRRSFPGSDYALVRYDSGRAGDGAEIVAIGDGNGVRITGLADPVVGQRVFRSGSTTGLRDGTVTALNATVNYPEGTVTGLIETTVCAEPGDSGGPLFSEGIALGVTSGGSGDCAVGGTTFFQPVTTALTELGVRMIVARPEAVADQSGAGRQDAAPSQGAAAPGATTPGSSAPVTGIGSAASGVLGRLTDARAVGPGLFVIGGSLVALVATRYIRAEQDRRAYQRYYSATWG